MNNNYFIGQRTDSPAILSPSTECHPFTDVTSHQVPLTDMLSVNNLTGSSTSKQDTSKTDTFSLVDSSSANTNTEQVAIASKTDNLHLPSADIAPIEKQEASNALGTNTFCTFKYCGRCTLKQLFSSKGCFKKLSTTSNDNVSFPYLDMSGLSEADKRDLEYQLMTDAQEIITQFADLMADIEVFLEESKIPLSRIKSYILNLRAFTNNLGVKVLDEDDKQKIREAETLSAVFITLCEYVSFLNYHIVESIVNKYGSANARKILQDYIQAFKSFCQRSIFEVPEHTFSSDCTSRKMAHVLVFKHTETGDDRIEEIKQMIGKVASIFQLQPSTLQLCSIKKGCLELHFLISAAVADHILPVSPSQHSALSEIGVKVLFCDETVNNESAQYKGELHQAWLPTVQALFYRPSKYTMP